MQENVSLPSTGKRCAEELGTVLKFNKIMRDFIRESLVVSLFGHLGVS